MGCPGSTCISPMWLERCKLSLSLSDLIPWGGGIGGDTASVLLGLKLGSPFILESLVDNAHMWEPSSDQPGRLEQM